MFDALKNRAVSAALNGVKEKVVNPNLDGIGKVTNIAYENKKLFVTVVLAGLEDKPVTVLCNNIDIAPDASSVSVSGFASNMPFAENALNRFLPASFQVPEGSTRMVLLMAKKALGL